MVYFYRRLRSKYFFFLLRDLRKESRRTLEEIAKDEDKEYLPPSTLKSYDSYGSEVNPLPSDDSFLELSAKDGSSSPRNSGPSNK